MQKQLVAIHLQVVIHQAVAIQVVAAVASQVQVVAAVASQVQVVAAVAIHLTENQRRFLFFREMFILCLFL